MYGEFRYRDGIKYQVYAKEPGQEFEWVLDFDVLAEIRTEYYSITHDGLSTERSLLTVHDNYCFDGGSGPAIDSRWAMPAYLAHDALYQAIREEKLYLPEVRESIIVDTAREKADYEFYRILLWSADKSWPGLRRLRRMRAWVEYRAVRVGGAPFANPARKRKVLGAP